MAYICICEDEISIPSQGCKFNVREIVKMAFASPDEIGFDPSSNIDSLAFWELRVKGSAPQKVVVSPFILDSVLTPGEPEKESSLNNSEDITEFKPSVYEGQIRGASAEIIAALKQYMCQPKVNVYFFNDCGQIIYRDVSGVAKGIEVTNMKVLDRNNVKQATDKNTISFQLKYGWENDILKTDPDFDPLTDLDNIELDVNNAIWSTPNNLIWSTLNNVTYS